MADVKEESRSLLVVGKSMVATHSGFALAAIIVLVILVIGMYLYYNDLLPVSFKHSFKPKKSESSKDKKEKKPEEDKTEEAELIKKINDADDTKG